MNYLNAYDNIFDMFDEFDRVNRFKKIIGCNMFSEPGMNYSTTETEDSHIIRVALPGHSKESVKVNSIGDRLTIIATVNKNNNANLIQNQEFRFKLPKTCDLNKIEALLENGILTIKLNKIADSSASKQIEVKVN